MVIADQFRPACPACAVSREQRRRVDLEPNERLGRNICRRADRIHLPVCAEKQAAALLRGSFFGFCQQSRDDPPCYLDIHAQILTAMGANETVIEGVTGKTGGRIDKVLSDACGLSRERIKALLGDGRVTLDGKVQTQASFKAPAGSTFAITVPEVTAAEAQAQDIPLVVVYEDSELIVIDKPAGLVVHPAAGNLDGTLVNALLHHCRGQLSGIGGVARPGIVHRIDKDTSGLLVVAKTDRAHEGLARQFADHSIERAYLAVVGGRPVPTTGTIEGAIGRSSANRKKMAVVTDGRGKHAITHYRTVEYLTGSTLIECRLETGRTHQVRVHLSSIGHALLGDPAYGRTHSSLRSILQRLGFFRQALHAAELGFVHPVSGETVHFVSKLPVDMGMLIDELRN